MLKYLLIIAIGFGAYKAFFTPDGILKSAEGKVYSSEYKFQVEFPYKPKENTKVMDVPEYGKFKTTSFYIRKPEFACAVVVSDYLELAEVPGDIYDQIRVVKRHLLKDDSSIIKEEFIYKDNVSGYQFDLNSIDNKLMQTQIFNYENNAYNLTCLYKNSNEYKAKLDAFMNSFVFI